MKKTKTISYKNDMAFPDPRSEGEQIGVTKLEYISTQIFSNIFSDNKNMNLDLDSLAVYSVTAAKALLRELNKQP